MASTSWKSLVTAFVCLLLLTGTLAGGLMQRQYGGENSNRDLLNQAAAALDRPMPERIGNWRLFHEPELEPGVVEMLRCPAYINRVYVHEQTGDRISVAVLLGPARTIAVHTPEICYSSQDFTLWGERELAKLADGQRREHTFWDVGFRSNDFRGSKLRVLYAWSTGNGWEASPNPRFAFGGSPYLYKVQIAGTPVGELTEFDACRDFLTQFVPLLQTQLVTADPT